MPTKSATAVLVFQKELKWGSCKSISANLRSAYQLALGKGTHTLHYPPAPHFADLWSMAHTIKSSQPRKLIFVDHLPHPLALLRALRAVYAGCALPHLVFHVYGDFTLHSVDWLAAGEIMAGERVTFLCASPRHAALMAGFLHSPETHLPIVPFPVRTEDFNYSEKLRKKWRKKLGASERTRVFLFSGRISLQKNVAELVKLFGRLPAGGVEPLLLLAGAEDDLDGPPFGVSLPAGTYGAEVRSNIVELTAKNGPRVVLLGSVGRPVMNALYNAADSYVSLSLHHDEDFGMSVAEAQCTGLPCALTDWGGFTSFVREPSDGYLTPVVMQTRGLELSRSAFRESLEGLLVSAGGKAREKRAERHRPLYSVGTCAASLATALAKPVKKFEGFSERLSHLAFQCTSRKGAAFSGNRGKGTLYEKIYAPYFE